MKATTFHEIPISWENDSLHPHILFFKKHIQKDAQENKTIFALNVPCYCSKKGLSNIFSDCGGISSIVITENPGTYDSDDAEEKESKILKYLKKTNSKFKYAYITFKEASSVDMALEMSSSVVRHISLKDNPVLTGLEKWITNYKYLDENDIQQDADEYLRKYDKKEWQKNENSKHSSEPDEEGWVTIPVKNKVNKQQDKKKTQMKKNEKNKRKEKELMNFYLFQQREAKRDKVAELRKQFEEDKKRVIQMRQSRKFKPF